MTYDEYPEYDDYDDYMAEYAYYNALDRQLARDEDEEAYAQLQNSYDEIEADHWNYLYSLVIASSDRLDDTPIFNRLSVERKVWEIQPHCPHGMSPELCEGPMHYPDDRYDWEF